MEKITIQLFGAFRDFEGGQPITLTYHDGMSVADLKAEMARRFDGAEPYTSLLSRSRIADSAHIFAEGDLLTGPGDYAILPPVNGG